MPRMFKKANVNEKGDPKVSAKKTAQYLKDLTEFLLNDFSEHLNSKVAVQRSGFSDHMKCLLLASPVEYEGEIGLNETNYPAWLKHLVISAEQASIPGGQHVYNPKGQQGHLLFKLLNALFSGEGVGTYFTYNSTLIGLAKGGSETGSLDYPKGVSLDAKNKAAWSRRASIVFGGERANGYSMTPDPEWAGKFRDLDMLADLLSSPQLDTRFFVEFVKEWGAIVLNLRAEKVRKPSKKELKYETKEEATARKGREDELLFKQNLFKLVSELHPVLKFSYNLAISRVKKNKGDTSANQSDKATVAVNTLHKILTQMGLVYERLRQLNSEVSLDKTDYANQVESAIEYFTGLMEAEEKDFKTVFKVKKVSSKEEVLPQVKAAFRDLFLVIISEANSNKTTLEDFCDQHGNLSANPDYARAFNAVTNFVNEVLGGWPQPSEEAVQIATAEEAALQAQLLPNLGAVLDRYSPRFMAHGQIYGPSGELCDAPPALLTAISTAPTPAAPGPGAAH